ncbi:MAG: flagellar hook-associated protein FlgL [Burkholderiaceae bacterium]
MSRVSTANTFEAGISTLQRRQRELADAQEQLTSGKRISRISDDPGNAARAERAHAAELRADADQRALEASRAAVTQVEAAYGDANDLLQQARELLVSAGNSTYSTAERQAIAERLRGLRDQLLKIANRGDGAGGYLFGGQGIGQAPFVDAAGGVQYVAPAGTQQAASDELLPLAADGQRAWLGASSGNGVFVTAATTSTGSAWIDAGRVTQPAQITGDPYSVQFTAGAGGTTYTVLRNGTATALANVPYVSGQAISLDGMSFTITGAPANGDRFDITPASADLSLFDAMDRMVGALGNASASATQVTQAVSNGLRDLDASTAAMSSRRADAGAWLNRLDDVGSRVADQRLRAQNERSNAEDLDMVHAVSEFQQQQTGYDAALKAYSMVQRLSLFNYLGS